ncbi:MAG: hypothetical protein Q6J68_00635 [Thermostichales cyanobacterium SZTDM-1c_bins_54]
MVARLLSPLVTFVQRLGSLLPRLPRPEPGSQQSQAFFLDPDEAKTLGNVEYMRTPRTVRKTFPKIVGNQKETLEIIESVSAVEKVRLNQPEPEPTPAAEASPPGEAPEAGRRRPSDDLNPWRSLAREIRKP